MSLFDINYRKLRKMLLPVRLRKPKTLAFLKAITLPIVELYGKFRLNRDKNLYTVSHGVHVAHLEGMLNDRYDNAFRRIRVEDAPLTYQPVMIYKSIENKPVYIYQPSENSPKFLFTDKEIRFGGIDFIVKVPVSIVYDMLEMRAFVSENKFPGMGFVIQDV